MQRSADRGQNWRTTSRVGGEPYRFKAIGRDELYLALSDGTILHARRRAHLERGVSPVIGRAAGHVPQLPDRVRHTKT